MRIIIEMTKFVMNLLNTFLTGFALWKLLLVAKRLRSTNSSLGLKRGTVTLHIFLLLLSVVSSAAITSCFYFNYQADVYIIVTFCEYGVDTLLQLMIGYICATMATDRRMNCNIVLVQK
jgi:hypothetical protein